MGTDTDYEYKPESFVKSRGGVKYIYIYDIKTHDHHLRDLTDMTNSL